MFCTLFMLVVGGVTILYNAVRDVTTTMDKDYEFIVNLFEKYKNFYPDLISQAESITPDKSILSNRGMIEPYPYHDAMSKFKKPKIYMEAPDSHETYLINHFTDGECYLAINGIHKEFGTWFSIKDDNCVLTLQFLGDASKKDGVFILDQMYCVLYVGTSIGKMIYYNYRIMRNPKYPPKETLMVDSYCYNDGLLDKIVRDGFWEKKSTVLPTRTFSFEYSGKKVSIYSEQANMNNEIIKSKLYTGAIKS